MTRIIAALFLMTLFIGCAPADKPADPPAAEEPAPEEGAAETPMEETPAEGATE